MHTLVYESVNNIKVKDSAPIRDPATGVVTSLPLEVNVSFKDIDDNTEGRWSRPVDGVQWLPENTVSIGPDEEQAIRDGIYAAFGSPPNNEVEG